MTIINETTTKIKSEGRDVVSQLAASGRTGRKESRMARNTTPGLRVKHLALLLTFEKDALRSSPVMAAKSRRRRCRQ